jgi:PhzF family phenazine biosynthesis protein
MKLPLWQVDAFADRPFAGNPAAVMPLEAWLDDALLQAIAAENNLSETAFTVPIAGGDADYELRWFTPGLEVALCGHATLAAGHVLLGDRDAVRFRTREAGMLEVRRAGAGYELDLPTAHIEPVANARVAEALGVDPVAMFSGPQYTMSVLQSEAEVRALDPDLRALAEIFSGDVGHIVTAPGAAVDFVSRMFAPNAGIDEDPVTGSAHTLLVPYWAERLGKTVLTAFQASARGGHLDCRLEGERTVLGGKCVTVIEGLFRL